MTKSHLKNEGHLFPSPLVCASYETDLQRDLDLTSI